MTKKELTTIVEMFKMQGFTLNEVADTVMAVYNTAPQVAEPKAEKPAKQAPTAKVAFTDIVKAETAKGNTLWQVGLTDRLEKAEWQKIHELAKANGGFYYAKGRVWSFKLQKNAKAFVKAVK